MAVTTLSASTPLVLLGQQTGITIIPAQTPLTRLNYFDGKFLRAQDLLAEQNYLRQLTQLSNQANGFGVVHGFNVELAGGDQLSLSAGLAVDPRGRVLLLGQEQKIAIHELIEHSKQLSKLLQSSTLKATGGFAECVSVSEAPTTNAVAGRDWYLLTIAHAEALCGNEDVYGKLCEEACVTSTDRPYRLEGVVLRALPLVLSTPLAQSSAVQLNSAHLQSQIASAYYTDEAKRVGSLISRAGLDSDTWCFGALGLTGNEVPIGVMVRSGATTLFVDEWIARRELIETSPRRYWQWRMSMRPWDVYQAQICQFQCQLHEGLMHGGSDMDDPCAEAKRLVQEAATHFKTLNSYYKQTTSRLQKMTKAARDKLLEDSPELVQNEQYAVFEAKLQQATQAFQLLPQDRLLIRAGIVETPSAGYLPVIPGDNITVNQQVRRMLGEGVDLRFCIVRPDCIPHALEEAQHMERISLLQGLNNPNDKPKVDVLVPYGKIVSDRIAEGRFYEMRMNLLPENIELLALALRLSAMKDDQQGTSLNTGAADGSAASAADATKLMQQYLALLSRDDRKAPQTFEYNGAARAEASTNGIAFYYSGITKSSGVVVQPAPAPAPAPTTPGTTGVAAGASIGAAAGLAFANRDALSEHINMRVLRPNANLAEREIETRSAIWLSFTMAQDPIELARNQSVAVKAECYLQLGLQIPAAKGVQRAAAAQTVSSVLRLGFNGELTVDDIAVRTGVSELREIKGTISGELTVSVRSSGLNANSEQSNFNLYLSEPVQVQRMPGAEGPLFKVVGSKWSFLQPFVNDIEVERKWTAAQKAEAIGTIEFLAPNVNSVRAGIAAKATTRQAFRAWQTINANVSEPQHPAHEDAIRALRSIASGLSSPKFADLSAQRLFPPPAPKSSDLNVFATQDWVMFHRRREKNCQQETPQKTVEVRQYAVYHVQLTGDQTLADLRRQLERTAANTKLPNLDFVQLVEFGAGIHAVTSPHAQVQASWRQDVGSDAGNVVGGFIASHGVAAAEGERLAQERIESLVDVLEPAHPADVTRNFAVLTRVPDALNAVSNDGVIIVATVKPQIKYDTHAVYHFNTQHDTEFNQLLDAAQKNDLNRFQAAIKNGTLLGVVKFPAGSVQPTDNALDTIAARWQVETSGGVIKAEIIYPAQLDTAANAQSKQQIFMEASAIGLKIGYVGRQSFDPAATTLALPDGVSAITAFLARSTVI